MLFIQIIEFKPVLNNALTSNCVIKVPSFQCQLQAYNIYLSPLLNIHLDTVQ